MERMIISGVAKDAKIARVAVLGVPDKPGLADQVFGVLSKAQINVDIILQSAGKDSNTNDISFVVAQSDADAAREVLEEYESAIGYAKLSIDPDVAKVSIVGAGMMNTAGIAVKMFEALSDKNINIQMISSSEIKLSVVIAESEADAAVSAIHEKFFGEA